MSCLQDTLDAVETLLKKHEAFERAAATQEERFLALERITTVSEYTVSCGPLKLFVVCDTSQTPTSVTLTQQK